MRIGIDGSLLGARFSGVERSVAQTVRALARTAAADDELLLFVGQGFDDYVATYHPDGFDATGRVRLVRTGLDNAWRPARIWWQQMVLPRLVDNCECDLFHAPAYISPRAMRLPRVVTVYDVISLDHPDFATFGNRLHYRLLLPAGVRRATRVIVPSEATRADLLRWVPSAEPRLRVVPLGVEDRFAGADAESVGAVRARFRLPERYWLWVGNVEPKKNVAVLLRALAMLRDEGKVTVRSPLKLVLAGPLSWGANDLLRLFLREGLQRHVQFLGRVTDAELPALYRGAAAFLFPSLAEGFGLPLLEAMSAGVPVVASTAGALPEVVGEAGLLVNPADHGAWAQAMWRVLEDDELRARLIAGGRQRAGGYGWERAAAATWNVYREALAVGEDEYDHATGRWLYGRI